MSYPRTALPLVFLSCFTSATAQSFHSDNFSHGGIGLSFGSMNFQKNGTGGLSFLFRRDILKYGSSSLSLGTNLKLGTVDQLGVVFPFIVLIALAPQPTNPDLSNSTDWVGFFSDIPVLLNYNFGLGSDDLSRHRFGFYLGGGMGFTVTAVTNYAGAQQNTSYLGWVANAGIRFARDKDIGFSATIPLRNPIGPIYNPVLYQMTFSIFPRH
jgi:hypothetical protein